MFFYFYSYFIPHNCKVFFKQMLNTVKGVFGTYSHHVVTLHIRIILVLALVVELAEEVEGHHSVEVDHHGQQTHSQHQLQRHKRQHYSAWCTTHNWYG